MSSHHIIREKQEPALFILNNEKFSGDHLGQLLEWSPTVVVTNENYEQVESLGIKIDAVVAPEGFFPAQPSLKVIPLSTRPLRDGISFLIALHYPAVNIIADAFDEQEYSSFTDSINLVIYLPGHKIFPVSSGFSKWKEAGEPVELLQSPSGLVTKGLKPVSGNRFETLGDGFYSLHFDERTIFIKEDL